MGKYKIWYGKYGDKEKTISAKNSSEVHKKWGYLDIHQIVKLKGKKKKKSTLQKMDKYLKHVAK